MKANAILIKPRDNVLTVVEGAKKGDEIRYFNDGALQTMTAGEDIPPCHKIARVPIKNGEHVVKYGESIGGATVDIEEGQHVAHHNIMSLPRDYESELG